MDRARCVLHVERAPKNCVEKNDRMGAGIDGRRENNPIGTMIAGQEINLLVPPAEPRERGQGEGDGGGNESRSVPGFQRWEKIRAWRDSNPQPADPKSAALSS